MSESQSSEMPSHGAVSPAPQNVGEGFEKAAHERGRSSIPEGLLPRAGYFLEHFGHMMSRVVLTVLYFLLIAPVGIFYRFIADPFLYRYPKNGTSLTPWRSQNTDIDQARRQG